MAEVRRSKDDKVASTRHAARRAGCRFYIGDKCHENIQHGNVRYTENGKCVECERARYQTRKSKERAKTGGDARKCAEGDFEFVAFTLGSVEGIQKWMASMARKRGAAL